MFILLLGSGLTVQMYLEIIHAQFLKVVTKDHLDFSKVYCDFTFIIV